MAYEDENHNEGEVIHPDLAEAIEEEDLDEEDEEDFLVGGTGEEERDWI